MRVLVVEDDPRLADVLTRGLRAEGMSVRLRGDGAGALEEAQQGEFDAIVLDVMLPDSDGFDICRRLRGAGVWAPVLMLTARTDVADRVAGLDGGADDYMGKPFAWDELLAR